MKLQNYSLKTLSRLGGVLYLIIIFCGLFTEIVARGEIIVWGNPAATAANIVASQLLWRVGIALDIVMHICDVPLMLIFFMILRNVNKELAFLALLFNVVASSVLVSTKLSLFTPLFLLGNHEYLTAFDPGQLYALSHISLRADSYGFGFGLIFFAFTLLINGYLIFRSGFLPKLIGALVLLGGICYLINSFIYIIFPQYSNILFPYILLPALIGELSIALYLLVKGVKDSDVMENN